MKFFSYAASIVRFAVVAFALAITAPAFAEYTPPTLPGAKTISADEVQAMVGKAAILDVRKKASYLDGHLPTAASIRHAEDKETKQFAPTVFGADKAAAIVIHGHGSDGWSAVAAVKSAVDAGYTNVHWFRGGIREWTEKGKTLAN